jgi:hypothetical protein
MTTPRVHRIHATPRPDGCQVELDGFVHQGLVDLIDLLRHDDVLWEDLTALIDNPPAPPDQYRPEVDLPTESLVVRLAAHLPVTVRLERKATASLGATLTGIARQQARTTAPVTALPQQQDRRAS